jgi:glycine cleavage system H protein
LLNLSFATDSKSKFEGVETVASIPGDLKYSETHEWVRVENDVATIGITDHAQAELGDITYLDLPKPGRILEADSQFGEVESVKAVSELFAPVSGEVIEANTAIADTTEVVNEDPYGNGWLIRVRISNPAELSKLLDPVDYEKFAGEGGH